MTNSYKKKENIKYLWTADQLDELRDIFYNYIRLYCLIILLLINFYFYKQSNKILNWTTIIDEITTMKNPYNKLNRDTKIKLLPPHIYIIILGYSCYILLLLLLIISIYNIFDYFGRSCMVILGELEHS